MDSDAARSLWVASPKELLMYSNILNSLDKNMNEITHTTLEEIHTGSAIRYYTALSHEVFSRRISQVISDVHKKLGLWLREGQPKTLLLASYLDLGAARCRQCVPLEEITSVILMIRTTIRRAIGMPAVADGTPFHDLQEKALYSLDLLFAGIVQSVISGYCNELESIIDRGQLSANCPVQILMQHYFKRMQVNRELTNGIS